MLNDHFANKRRQVQEAHSRNSLERPPTEGIPSLGPGPTCGQLALHPQPNPTHSRNSLKNT